MATVKHVRRPGVPWRPPADLSACGRGADSSALIGFEEFRKIRAAAFTGIREPVVLEKNTERKKMVDDIKISTGVCRACWTSLRYAKTWDEDPVDVLTQYVKDAECWAATPEFLHTSAELRAITDLVAQHADEFNQLVGRHAAFIGLGVTQGIRRLP